MDIYLSIYLSRGYNPAEFDNHSERDSESHKWLPPPPQPHKKKNIHQQQQQKLTTTYCFDRFGVSATLKNKVKCISSLSEAGIADV